jgi:hypothetical protein
MELGGLGGRLTFVYADDFVAEGIGCCHGWRGVKKTGWKIAEQLKGLDGSKTINEVLVCVETLLLMALEEHSSVDIEAHHRLTRARH